MSADYRMPRQRPRFTRPKSYRRVSLTAERGVRMMARQADRRTVLRRRYSARRWRTEGCTLIVYSRQANVMKTSTVKCKTLIDSERSTRCAPFRSRFLFSEMPIKQLERSRPRTSRRRDLSVGGRFGATFECPSESSRQWLGIAACRPSYWQRTEATWNCARAVEQRWNRKEIVRRFYRLETNGT
ncbi:hypothetical protein PMI06_006692 [Burkholderia sp. BT03]|nr:hypothetical protein PMI06_006692 [Burkholderia sp. BT03]SKC93735.1 hypothetical protein SAMN06266956_5733 [Paraburkholderia hospita]